MEIRPANGGILLEASDNPASCDVDDNSSPRIGYVIRVGGGVPWLKPRQAVAYNPRRATRFFTNQVLVQQQDVVAVLEGVERSGCVNGCDGIHTGCSDCPPLPTISTT